MVTVIPLKGKKMEKFWKAAIAVGGLAAIGAFVFWSLYKDWLSLQIFSKMSSEQTFTIMIIFLVLTFIALIVLVVAYFFRGKNKGDDDRSEHVFKLHDSWNDVNEIDCDRLIGPDVTTAVRAMTITASSWLNELVDREIIMQNHFEDFETLYTELISCNKVVPGFEKKGLKCKDFLSKEMEKSYSEMKNFQRGGKK